MPTTLSSYYVGYLVSEDADLMRRVAACAQKESTAASVDIGDPLAWAADHAWEYAMTGDWVAKVESAIVGGIVAWGQDPSVISDADVLSFVQPEILGGT